MTEAGLLEIRRAFAIEGAELLAEMESALLALEVDSAAAPEFGLLFRTVHTIKGSASIVRFELVEQFCHSIENILVRIRKHELSMDKQLVLLLLKCHDHIGSLMDRYCASVDVEDNILPSSVHEELLDRLMEWAKDVRSFKADQPMYGVLDESYLDIGSEVLSQGLNLFEDSDEVSLHQEQLPLISSDDSAASSEKNARNQGVVRVDAARIDQLSDLVVELVTASSVLEAQVRVLGDLAATESSVRVADLVKQIQEKSMSFRMIPVQTLFQRFNRIIHDVASTSGKQIRLLISGGETELDKAIAEKLHEPLLHLVRNAIDHGIESAGERSAQGKSPAGTIHMDAFQDSGNIIIRVSDDGGGINLDAVARKALERGLVKTDSIPVGKDLLACIFEPGFSTLEDATMLSGRGVGMDVVRKAVESIRGKIDVQTDAGAGTVFQISIPLSLSLVDCFMVSLGDNLYIMPMELVLETLELPDSEQLALMPNGGLQVREQLLPCLDLRKILGVKAPVPPLRHVVIFRHDGKGVGLIVDQLHGEIKSVVKPLGQLYRNVTCVSGSSILGDGSIALFLETGKLVEVSG